MTTLAITPNWKKKTAKAKGAVAAGEHVVVRIANDDGTGVPFVVDTTDLCLRVVGPGGATLAQFPEPEGTDGWDSDVTPLSCVLNLNTVQMLQSVPPGPVAVPLLLVLGDYDSKTLYFKCEHEFIHWPRRVGEEEPTDLDGYKDIIRDFDERIDGVAAGLAAHAGDGAIHVTASDKAAWTAKYDKPSSGIPSSDLVASLQTSLAKADSALQSHQDISGKADKADVEAALALKKDRQSPVSSPLPAGVDTMFIASITQDENGVISASKKSVALASPPFGGTSGKAGLMSAADKAKLDGIAAGANNYVLPAATASTLGGVKQGANVTIAADGTISASASVDVVPPSVSAAPGQAADAKATGTALYTGFTDWEFSGSGYDSTKTYSVLISPSSMEGHYNYELMVDGSFVESVYGTAEEPTSVEFEYGGGLVATRHLVTPTKTSQLTNDSGFLTQHQDISGKANVADVNAVLALKADKATTYTKTEIDSMFDDLSYTPIAVSSFSVSPSSVEVGSTVTSVTFSYTLNKAAASAMLDGGTVTLSGKTGTIPLSVSLAANKTWTLSVTDAGSSGNSPHTATKTATLSFLWKRYWGAAAEPASVDDAFLNSVLSGKELGSGRSKTFTANAGTGQYIWYAVPKAWGACSFKVGGFDGGFRLVAETFGHVNEGGGMCDYRIYRSDNAALGNTTVVVS